MIDPRYFFDLTIKFSHWGGLGGLGMFGGVWGVGGFKLGVWCRCLGLDENGLG